MKTNPENLTHIEKKINMAAAMIEITTLIPISYPLDTIKSRIQVKYYDGGYKGLFKNLVNFEHNKSLYRGMGFLYTGLMLKQPIKMAAFEAYSDKSPFYGSIAAFCCGLIPGIPISYIKTNYQTNNTFKLLEELKKLRLKDATNKIRLTNAWHYEICKEGTGNIIFYTMYGYIRKNNNMFGKDNEHYANFINGASSSIIANFFAQPVDVMKVRKQTIQRDNTFKEIFLSIANMEGHFNLGNFWKGMAPIFVRVGVFGGVGMYVYEKVKLILTKKFVNKKLN